MDDNNIYEDLEKLFEECDDVTKSFNESVETDCTIVDKAEDDNAQSTWINESSQISSQESKTEIAQSDVTAQSVKRSWKIMQTNERIRCCTSSEQCSTEEGKGTYPYVEKGYFPILSARKERTGTVELFRNNSSVKESSMEEGECSTTIIVDCTRAKQSGNTKTLVEGNSLPVLQEKCASEGKVGKKINYSSFIESSREDGECSTTSFEEDEFETTVMEVFPQNKNEDIVNNEAIREEEQLPILKREKEDFKREFNSLNNLKKRKRSISERNENTPKRRHLFTSEDVLSPISCVSAGKWRNTLEMAETPLIESKFNFQTSDICSSTPVTTCQKFSFPSSENCSTPVSSTTTGKQSIIAKKAILPDSDSDFEGFSDVDEITDKHQTVDELIAEITQLCGDDNETSETERNDNDEVREKSDKTVSKIEVFELINEWKTRSSGESATDTETSIDGDRTLTENDEACSQNVGIKALDSDVENLTVISAVDSLKKNEKEKKEDESFIEDKGGRFQAEVTVSRIEVKKSNETNREVIDMDISDSDNQEQQYGEDLLNLDDYDDEGFVDANILEKSHLTKDLNLTIKAKDATENNDDTADKGKETGEYKESLFELVSSLRKEAQNKTESRDKVKKDVNENVVKGLDYAAFDTSIYRKTENTAIEREICRRWKTNGAADPDVNLTFASTKRNSCKETGEEPLPGYLEGDRVVCTYLYEEEIMSSFQYYGKTEGQSDLCYMTLENLLGRLYNQKIILENMNRHSLLNIKSELQWQLGGTKGRHCQELEALKYRQALEDEQFRFNSRNHFNVMEFQHRLMQLRQEHISQQGRLKEHHQMEFCAVRSRGMEILQAEISRHSAQCEPIDQLIEQLEKPESCMLSSSQKYGPAIVVSLRKGPCKATNGRHSTVPVCLSAGIAQAVSLEDDLYDHFYGY